MPALEPTAVDSADFLRSRALDAAARVGYVAALTIVDAATLVDGEVTGATELLLGVRRAETNGDHREVASVPTKRVPEPLFRAASASACEPLAAGDGVRFLDGAVVTNHARPGANPLTDIVEGVLARKLGLADALEHRLVSFSAQARVLKTGSSPRLRDEDGGEPLAMLNVLVVLRTGRRSIPASTASYSLLSWLRVDRFLDRAMQDRSLSLAGPHAEARYVCGGLCICTADLLLRALSHP
jgi:hypothetical protein